MNNQRRLVTTIQLMLQGIELNEEDKKQLTQPEFKDEGLQRSENVVEKIGKFFKYQQEK